MIDSIYSVCVWVRRSPRGRWKVWGRFINANAAINTIAKEKAANRLVGETLTVCGDRDPNQDGKKARRL